MADLERYRQCIESVLTERARRQPEHSPIKANLAFDRERDHYLLVNSGWNQQRRLYGTVSHIRIVEGKIYIEYEGFEDAIADELVRMGVPASEIVLGYREPMARKLTAFGRLPSQS